MATDAPDDLARKSCALVRFRMPAVETRSPWPRVLQREHRWFVGSKSDCSCTFRHLSRGSVSLGFGAPADWFPEDQDEVDATHCLYGILRELVQRGHRVELLDCWSGDEDKDAVPVGVSFTEVPAAHFRLFEGYVFDLKP